MRNKDVTSNRPERETSKKTSTTPNRESKGPAQVNELVLSTTQETQAFENINESQDLPSIGEVLTNEKSPTTTAIEVSTQEDTSTTTSEMTNDITSADATREAVEITPAIPDNTVELLTEVISERREETSTITLANDEAITSVGATREAVEITPVILDNTVETTTEDITERIKESSTITLANDNASDDATENNTTGVGATRETVEITPASS